MNTPGKINCCKHNYLDDCFPTESVISQIMLPEQLLPN